MEPRRFPGSTPALGCPGPRPRGPDRVLRRHAIAEPIPRRGVPSARKEFFRQENRSGFRKRRTAQNDPMGSTLIHSPSVPFDSLAPARLARLAPSGPTFGCSSSKAPTFPLVVNSAGFGSRNQRDQSRSDKNEKSSCQKAIKRGTLFFAGPFFV